MISYFSFCIALLGDHVACIWSCDHLRLDYGDARVSRGSSTKIVICQLCIVIFRHAIHD